jgi:hypothetical protein
VASRVAPVEVLQRCTCTREGRTFLPTDGTLFCKGDRLHIALLGVSSDRLRTLLGLG